MLRRTLLLLLLVGAVPGAVSAEERPLRLVTFNMLHGGPWASFTGDDRQLESRLVMIIDRLRALDADIVALQEAPITRRRGNVPGRVAEALGFTHVHALSTERVFPLRFLGRLITRVLGFDAGLSIVSRYPIVASEVHELPRCRRWLDPRIALQADIDTPAGRLVVFSVHTSRDDCQTRRVAELARAHRGAAVVMGDLNTTEGAAALAAFRDDGFVDLYRAANPEGRGATVWQNIYEPSPTVSRRVDYVLLRSGPDDAADVVSSRVVLNTPGRGPDGGTLWPSDHYGVMAEVRLTPVTRISGR